MEPLLASQLQPFLHRPTYLLFGISCVENFRSSTFTTVSKLSASLIQRASLSPAFLTLTTAPVTSSPLISACSPIRKRRRLSQTSSACLCSLLATHRPPAMLASSSQSGDTWRKEVKLRRIRKNDHPGAEEGEVDPRRKGGRRAEQLLQLPELLGCSHCPNHLKWSVVCDPGLFQCLASHIHNP